MAGIAMLIRFIAVIAIIIGIVNISGIPDNADLAFGVVFLAVGIGGWFLANQLIKAAYDSIVKKYTEGEALTKDEAELLNSRQ